MDTFTLVAGFSLIVGVLGFLVGVSAGRHEMSEHEKVKYLCLDCGMEVVFFIGYDMAHLGKAHHGFTVAK